MWFRPRVENLPIELDWQNYDEHEWETIFSWFCVGLNIVFMALATIGVILRPRFAFAMLAYILLRSAILATIEAPEARYTIECYPLIFVLSGVCVASLYTRLTRRT